MSALSLFISCVLLSETVLCWSRFHKNARAEAGQNVTLPCQLPLNNTVLDVGWRRIDSKRDKIVLRYQDEKIDESIQSPYLDRVALKDIKKGDVSLVLEDTRTNDSGFYECMVYYRDFNEADRGLLCIIWLIVFDSSPTPVHLSRDEKEEDEGNNDDEYEPNNGGNMTEHNKFEENKVVKEVKKDIIIMPIFFVIIISIAAFVVYKCFVRKKEA
ncbi:uncharacterized protein LOC119793736 [Cyprinodon tularosa]|uniref:uncharacterized protein LOC119793736 n=1 Tax=Cyprinodon tularosa TaxID=77115 RepID=UPI0018E275DD|nr:uncharacterized protein LOC119793736 [Cyprinodon tularosa]XP_038156911.1 uncharacterized protein LOC119793736 [Cyprinodon tularosa]